MEPTNGPMKYLRNVCRQLCGGGESVDRKVGRAVSLVCGPSGCEMSSGFTAAICCHRGLGLSAGQANRSRRPGFRAQHCQINTGKSP